MAKNKIYSTPNPLWWGDTFIFSYNEDYCCYVYVKVNSRNKIEEIGIDLESRMHNTKFADMKYKREANRLQKSIFNRIGEEYWSCVYGEYERVKKPYYRYREKFSKELSPEAQREILQKLEELSNQPCDFRSIVEELDNIAKR